MHVPDQMIISGAHNKFIQDELCYDRTSLQEEHIILLNSLTDEQKEVYETIMTTVSKGE